MRTLYTHYAFHRGLKHMESMSRPQRHQSNAFAKHRLEYHQDYDARMEVKVDVVKNFPRPMQRQVWDGVEIREVSCDILLKSKLDNDTSSNGPHGRKQRGCGQSQSKSWLSQSNFGLSGMRALPLAAGINVGGHYKCSVIK